MTKRTLSLFKLNAAASNSTICRCGVWKEMGLRLLKINIASWIVSSGKNTAQRQKQRERLLLA